MTSTERQTVYEMVSEKLATAIEEGNVPWQKTWRTSAGSRRASNLISKKPYRGINILLTALAPYSSPWWLTYKQAKSIGGQVRKGEKGTMVVYWHIMKRQERGAKGQAVDVTIPLLKKYTVFNVEQCDGIPASKIPQEPIPAPASLVEANDAAEQVAAGYENGPRVVFGGDSAAYTPALDLVKMPERDTFDGTAEFYSTYFHELVHSTGHKSRINRLESTGFGTEPYAREELVAEIGACFLLAMAGLDVTYTNSAAYLKGWASKIRQDPKAIVVAAGAAQKATDWILGSGAEVVNEDDEDEAEAAA